MKRFLIVLLVLLIVAGVGFAGYYFTNKGGQDGGPEIDYPEGDTTPEHLAEVLGSYDAYEDLKGSNLRRPGSEMSIIYDIIRDDPTTTHKVAWVVLTMVGEVVEISESERIITITNEGETISLSIWKNVRINKLNVPLDLKDIKNGDQLSRVSVVVNAGNLYLPEARVITIESS